jgi:large repetitive protein
MPSRSATCALVFALCGPLLIGCGRTSPGHANHDAASAAPDDVARAAERSADGVRADGSDAGAPNLCGNGRLDPGEGCDDGNTFADDGCSRLCCPEPCWACSLGCLIAARRECTCGDGKLDPSEECDDGNWLDGDACNQFCERESPTCGNGVLEDHEECDDGNRVDGDGCSRVCLYDPIDIGCRVSFSVCADGKVTGRETCDDGNVFPGDGCSATCSVEPGYYCPTPGARCLPVPWPPVCGDGIVDPTEPCDDGINDGRFAGCNPDCTRSPRCGDGILQTDQEECDEGSGNLDRYGGGCGLDCRPNPYCGDGMVQWQYGEPCDDGFNDGRTACLPGCRMIVP